MTKNDDQYKFKLKFKFFRLYKEDYLGNDSFTAVELRVTGYNKASNLRISRSMLITKRELDVVKVFRFRFLLSRARILKEMFLMDIEKEKKE